MTVKVKYPLWLPSRLLVLLGGLLVLGGAVSLPWFRFWSVLVIALGVGLYRESRG